MSAFHQLKLYLPKAESASTLANSGWKDTSVLELLNGNSGANPPVLFEMDFSWAVKMHKVGGLAPSCFDAPEGSEDLGTLSANAKLSMDTSGIDVTPEPEEELNTRVSPPQAAEAPYCDAPSEPQTNAARGPDSLPSPRQAREPRETQFAPDSRSEPRETPSVDILVQEGPLSSPASFAQYLRATFSSEEQGLELMRVCAQGPGPRRKGGKGGGGLSIEEFTYVCMEWQLGTVEDAKMLFDKLRAGGGGWPATAPRPMLQGSVESLRFKDSAVLTPALVSDISLHFPPWAQNLGWQLAYSPRVHGVSIQDFYRRQVGPNVIIMRDADGFIFGGFASEGWRLEPYGYGSLESFVFAIRPRPGEVKPRKGAKVVGPALPQWMACSASSLA